VKRINLLENYIKEIYSEEIVNCIGGRSIIKVKMIVNCYGNLSEAEKIFFADEWKNVKSRGYYLA